MITIENFQVTTDTIEEFDVWDIEAGKRHKAHMIAQGFDGKTNINPRTQKPYPEYDCDRLMGTPEPIDGKYIANFSAYPWVANNENMN